MCACSEGVVQPAILDEVVQMIREKVSSLMFYVAFWNLLKPLRCQGGMAQANGCSTPSHRPTLPRHEDRIPFLSSQHDAKWQRVTGQHNILL